MHPNDKTRTIFGGDDTAAAAATAAAAVRLSIKERERIPTQWSLNSTQLRSVVAVYSLSLARF